MLIGDHQPPADIPCDDASWDVPVYIVSRDRKLLALFVEQGFHHGLEPPRKSLGPMHALTGMLLQAFSAPDTYHPVASVPLAETKL